MWRVSKGKMKLNQEMSEFIQSGFEYLIINKSAVECVKKGGGFRRRMVVSVFYY